MIKPSDIIKATGSDPGLPITDTNPLGTGYIFHLGKKFRCSGPDSHTVMTLLEVPLDGRHLLLDGTPSGVVPSERADEAKWELDPAQESMSAEDAVCQVCSSLIVS